MKKYIFLLFFVFINLCFANGSQIDLNTLYTHGNVSISSSSIKLGDLIIALATGVLAYLLLVGTFLFSFISVGKNYYAPDKTSGDALDIGNLAKLFLKPIVFLIAGLIFFNFMALLLKWYNIDIYKELKFFFEARYDIVVNNLDITHKLMPFGKNILIALDLISKFAFWSLIFVYLAIYLIIGTIISIIIVSYIQNDSEHIIYKKIFMVVMVVIIGAVSLNIFSSFSNHILFKEHPNINGIGVVSNINDANKKSFKYFAHLGLGGLQ